MAVSKDGVSWTDIGSATASNRTVKIPLDAGMFPAERMFVRVKGEKTHGVQLGVYSFTGMVTGKGLEGLVRSYFSQSLQIAASCSVFESDDTFFCIVAEQLPGESCDLQGLCGEAEKTFPQNQIPEGFEFLESTPLRFGCTCSRASLMRFVSAMSPEDRADLAEDGKIVTYCNACGKKYTFEL